MLELSLGSWFLGQLEFDQQCLWMMSDDQVYWFETQKADLMSEKLLTEIKKTLSVKIFQDFEIKWSADQFTDVQQPF